MLVRLLEIACGIFDRDDICQREERRLHNHIDTRAEAELTGNLESVDEIQFRVKLREFPFHHRRQDRIQLLRFPRTVQKEDAAVFETAKQIVFVNVARAVARDVIGAADEVRPADGIGAEAQMGNRDAAGFLGIVSEISLRKHVRVIADDFDRVLIRADGAVRSESPEFTGNGAVRALRHGHGRQREIRHVVSDGKREIVARILGGKMREDGHDVFGNDVFRAEAVASADDANGKTGSGDDTLDVEEERLTERPRLTRAVEDGDFSDGFGKDGEEMFRGKRAIEMDGDEPDLFAFFAKRVDDVLCRVAHRADGDHDAVRIGCAVVIKEMMRAAGDFGELVHVALHDIGQRVIIRIRRFGVLEINIRIFRRAANDGMIRRKRARAEIGERFLVDERREVFVGNRFYFLNFMARAETVEEIDEGDASANGGQMRHGGQIHDFLDIRFGQHGATGRPRAHHVLVIAENRKRVRGQSPGRDVKDTRQELAGDLVHIRNHEQHTLRRRVRRRERAALERTVKRPGRAAFGLHFHDADGVAENIFPPVRRPFIDGLGHRRRRRDGINRRHFRKRIGNIRRCRIAVHCFHVFQDEHLAFF